MELLRTLQAPACVCVCELLDWFVTHHFQKLSTRTMQECHNPLSGQSGLSNRISASFLSIAWYLNRIKTLQSTPCACQTKVDTMQALNLFHVFRGNENKHNQELNCISMRFPQVL